MTVPLACDRGGRIKARTVKRIGELAEPATCVALGPGMGRSKKLPQLVRSLYESLAQPLVIDADGLNALATGDNALAGPSGPRILTPHPGELARLVKAADDQKATRDEQIAAAKQLATEHRVVIVLKGHQSYITDGTQETINTTGNPGMATGGTGDVLTGVITALVCQGLAPFDAALLGAHVHGLAGDLAARDLGQVSLIASDLLRYLPKAFQSVSAG
jgi:NAD(P)H-hydrate epimerase